MYKTLGAGCHEGAAPAVQTKFPVEHEGGIWFSDNPERVRLADLQLRVRERFLYEYDFYDHREHDVRLENVLLAESERTVPVCIGGRGWRRRKIVAGRVPLWKTVTRACDSGGTSFHELT